MALFLSGYAIQQRTLRELRVAVKPRARRPVPEPQAYLPDYFKASTVTLDDGTVVENESEADREERLQRLAMIEVEATEQADEEAAAARLRVDNEARAGTDKMALVEELRQQAASKSWSVDHPDPLVKSRVPISRAERRRLIKEEMQRLSRTDQKVLWQPRLW
ncbi:hypothetical protein N3K66_000564 [Trichothecium roseum]|uniref:Uncharacterized protein n=1 Tax=Trichothecium roseum TaxID=47278 RepID=A0ACC0VDX4_9HYPO|nr:hypothetical protein N3K66_000564 [Trichothecium roseum]